MLPFLYYAAVGAQGVLSVAAALIFIHSARRSRTDDERESSSTMVIVSTCLAGVAVVACFIPTGVVADIMWQSFLIRALQIVALLIMIWCILKRNSRWKLFERDKYRLQDYRNLWRP